MDNTYFGLGLACIVTAIVGGGTKLFGYELPVVNSLRRQSLLAVLGIALAAGASFDVWEPVAEKTIQNPQSSPAKPKKNPVPPKVASEPWAGAQAWIGEYEWTQDHTDSFGCQISKHTTDHVSIAGPSADHKNLDATETIQTVQRADYPEDDICNVWLKYNNYKPERQEVETIKFQITMLQVSTEEINRYVSDCEGSPVVDCGYKKGDTLYDQDVKLLNASAIQTGTHIFNRK